MARHGNNNNNNINVIPIISQIWAPSDLVIFVNGQCLAKMRRYGSPFFAMIPHRAIGSRWLVYLPTFDHTNRNLLNTCIGNYTSCRANIPSTYTYIIYIYINVYVHIDDISSSHPEWAKQDESLPGRLATRSNESPSQEMAEVTHFPAPLPWVFGKKQQVHMELLKREQKHHSLGNPFNIPQKKTYPSRHFDSTRFWNLTTPEIHPVDNSADEVIFRNFHLMNFFNITTSLLSLIFCDRWECVVMSLTGDSLMMETCPNQKFLTLDSPPEEGEYNWSYLLICENQWLVRKVYGHIRTYKRNTLYIPFSLSSGIPLLYVIFFAKSKATRRFAAPLIAITKSKRDRPVWKETSEKTQVLIETELRLGFLGPGWVFKTCGFLKNNLCKFLHLPHLGEGVLGSFFVLRAVFLTLTKGHCPLRPSNLTLWICWRTCTL